MLKIMQREREREREREKERAVVDGGYEFYPSIDNDVIIMMPIYQHINTDQPANQSNITDCDQHYDQINLISQHNSNHYTCNNRVE